jgi:hypothetical protein
MENRWTSPNDQEADEQRIEYRRNVKNIYNEYKAMLPEVQSVVNSLMTTEDLNWKQTRAELRKQTQQEGKTMLIFTQRSGFLANNTLAVTLSGFLTAIHRFLKRYIAKRVVDEEVAVATVADKLEAVSFVEDVGPLLRGVLKIRVERGVQGEGIDQVKKILIRWLKALRNTESSSQQETGHITALRLSVWVGQSIYDDLVKWVRRWLQLGDDPTVPMIVEFLLKRPSDTLAMALAEFFRFMMLYQWGHEEDFMCAFSEDEKKLAEIGVANLDMAAVT